MKSSKKALIAPAALRSLATVHPFKNLGGLFLDYLVLFAVSGAAIWFHFSYSKLGLHWLTQIPVWAVAIFLNGCVAHRIGLMGHEASHHLLVPNRKWNDILAELLCFYPVYGSLMKYRAKHLPHHLHPNDPDQDPNLGSGKAERLYAKFPMPKRSFIYHYYLKFFWPPFVFANLLDLFSVIAVGSGLGPIPRDSEPKRRALNATILGIIYLASFVVGMRILVSNGAPVWASTLGIFLIGVIGWAVLPDSAFVKSAQIAIRPKSAGLLRMTYYTVQYTIIAFIGEATGWDPTLAYLLLWVVPLIYMFPYLMLLREIYQHANAGRDTFDNSRIIHADPFTQWAVLGYGNDFHLIHHIYPNIPHYQLRETHSQLMEGSEEYRTQVEENYGIIAPRKSDPGPPLIDSLQRGISPESIKQG